MDVWGPARVRGQGHERYFVLVVDDYSRYTTVFPLRSKGEVREVVIGWIRGTRRQISESFGSDLPVLRLHSDRGASPQKNGIAECRIGMVMDIAHTSIIHAAAPHFLWPFAVQYAAHQINLQPRVSLPETTPTLRWTGKVGDASAFRVWGSRAFVRDTIADKLSSRAGPAPSGVSQVDPAKPVELAVDSGAARGAEPAGPGTGGAGTGGAEPERVEPRGAESGGAESGRADPAGAEPGRVEPEGTVSGGAEHARGESGGNLGVPSRREPLSPQQLCEWYSRRCRGAADAGAAGASGGATSAAGSAAGAGAAGATAGAAAAGAAGGAGGAARGADGAGGAAGAGGVSEASGGAAGAGAAGGAAGAGAAGGAAGAGAARAAGGAARTGDPGAEGTNVVSAVSGGAARPRPYYVPLLQQVLGSLPSPGPPPPFLSPPLVHSQSQLQPASPLPGPSPYSGPTRCLTERREPESRPVSPESRSASPVRTVRAGHVSRPRPPPVPGTHSMTLRPSTAPQRVPLPSPPASSLPAGPDPASDSLRAASLAVTRFLATVVTDPLFESTTVSALLTKLVDFAAACRLDYATSLVAEPESASVSPPSVGGECALGTDVLEDRQEDFECFAASVPHLVSMLIAPEGDPDAPDIPTPGSYAEAIEGPYSSQVERPPGSPRAFKARYVARGFSQRQGVDFFQTFSPTPKMTILWVLLHVAAQRDYELHSLDFSTAFLQGSLHEEIWLRRPPGFTGSFPSGAQTTLAALGFAPSTSDPSLFLRTDTTLPPFYVLVYVDDLVFATATTEALAHVKSELQKRHTCTDLGELTSYLGLRITRDRAQRTITLTQSHMVQQVLQCFGFTYSSPQSTPLPTGHSLSAPPSDKSVEPSGPTSGMGLVLGGRARVVLTGHADASWVDDLATQRSSQGYTFSLGSGSVSWRSTRSSSVLSSSFDAEIYAGAMAEQELRWLTYLLTDLGEVPRSPPVLYVDNKAMLALCQEHRLEHRTKHIARRYFLARELHQRGQLRLAYVASQANTADVFTKALQPCDHQRFCTVLCLVVFTVLYVLLYITLHVNWPCGHLLVLRLRGDIVIHPELALPFMTGLVTSCSPPLCLRGHSFAHILTGIRQTFTLPASPQQNGIAERRIGMVMDVVRTSMIHVSAPYFLWPFAVQYTAHQINLQPRVSLLETTPTLRWTGKVGDASAFRVLDLELLSAILQRTSGAPVPFLDVTFDESVCYYRLFPYRTASLPPPPLFLAPGTPPVGPLPPQGPAPSGVSQVDPVEPLEVAVNSGAARGAEPAGAWTGGAEPRVAEPERVEPGGAESGGAESRRAELGVLSLSMWSLGVLRLGVLSLRVLSQEVPKVSRRGGSPSHRSSFVSAAGGATGAAGVVAGDPGAEGAGVFSAISRGTAQPQPYYVPLLQQVLGVPPSPGPTPPLLSAPPVQKQSQLHSTASMASPLPGPSSYSGPTRGLTERREPESRPLSPESRSASPVRNVRTGRRVSRPRPPPVPGTHSMTQRPSTAPQRVPLPSPPTSSLPDCPDPESDSLRTASPAVTHFLATAVTDPLFESTAASSFVAELVDFGAACRLDYATSLVAESESASVCPLSVGGTYVDEVPPPGANIVSGMWIFRVKRPPGSLPVFKARYVARGFSQRQGVDFFQTFSYTPKMTTLRVLIHVAAQRDYELHSLDFSTAFLQGSLHEEIWLRRPTGFTGSFPAGTQWSLQRPVYGLRQAPREWHDTVRTTLAALGFAPSTSDPSLFLRTDTTLPPFYVLVYVDDLVFATATTEALAHVKSELQKRHTCRDLGELTSYLGLRITRDRAHRTITLTHSHMVHQVLQRFGFMYSLPQSTPLPTGHSLSAPPSDDTSGMGLVLGGRARVVLTGDADASWVDDLATQRSSQVYTFSLGSGSVSWRSTRSSSVLSSSYEAEIYAGAMAAQELRWLTYVLTDLGEAPCSPPILYVDNKAMLALCQEHTPEHRTKHIALRYFLARELQQRGQLRLAYVASQSNTAEVFTKALQPCDHQRFCTVLCLVPTVPHLLTS
ncbi:unnamed protein product [Closterium sp. NIES-54]